MNYHKYALKTSPLAKAISKKAEVLDTASRNLTTELHQITISKLRGDHRHIAILERSVNQIKVII